jgi:lysophospholipase L1-like esterase
MKLRWLLPLLLLVGGCNPTAPSVSLYLGDSLMAQVAEEVQWEELTQDSSPVGVWNAIPGTGLHQSDEYWLPRIASVRSFMEVDTVYVSLGANDATKEVGEDVTPDIDKLMGAFAPTTQVYWVLPHKGIGGRRNEVARKIKEAPWGNLNVLNFDSWLARQGLTLEDQLDTDGVHLNPAGEKQWARMLREKRK